MSLSEKLELLVTMDPSQAVSQARSLAAETDRSMRAAESSLHRFASAGAKIGAGGIGVGALLTSIGSAEQEAAQQLDAAIQQVGQSVSTYRDRLESASSAQQQFGHTEADTNNAVATLTVAYNDTGQALDRLQLVSDLAARKHISLAEAASLVARAHGGSARVFREFGIQVDTNANGTKNYEGALDTLSQKLSGQAAASANSFMGHLRALGAEAHDFVANFGQNFGPAILTGSVALTAFSSVTAVAASHQERLAAAHTLAAEKAIENAAAQAEVAAAELLVTGNSAAAVASLYEEAIAADVATASTLAFVGVATLGIGAIIGIAAATGAFGDTLNVTVPGIDEYKSKLGQADTQTTASAAALTALNESVGSNAGLAQAFRDAGITTEQFVAALASGNDTLLAGANLSFKDSVALAELARSTEDAAAAKVDALVASGQLNESNLAGAEAAHTAADGTVNYVAVLNDLVSQGLVAQSAVDGLTGSLKQQEEELKRITAQHQAQISSARSLFDANRAEQTANDNLVQSQRNVATALDRVTDAERTLAEARKRASADDVTKANLDISDSQLRVADTAKAIQDAEDQLLIVRADGTKTPDDVAQAERKIEEARNAHERAILAERDAEKNLQDVQKKGTDQDKAVIDARRNLVDAEQGVVDAKGRVVDAYAAEADASAKVKQAQEELNGGVQTTNQALEDQINVFERLASQVDPNSPAGRLINEYLDKLLALEGSIPVLNPETQKVAAGPGPHPQFAGGGIMPGAPGQPGWAVLHGGEGIFTPSQMQALAGSGETVVQHIYAPVDPYEMARASEQERAKRRYLSKTGR